MTEETIREKLNCVYESNPNSVSVDSISAVTDSSGETLTEVILTVPHTRSYLSVDPHDVYISPLVGAYVELVSDGVCQSSIEVMICSRHERLNDYLLGGIGSFRIAKEWALRCVAGHLSVEDVAAFALNTYMSAPVEDAGLPWIPEYAGAIGWIPEYEPEWRNVPFKWYARPDSEIDSIYDESGELTT